MKTCSSFSSKASGKLINGKLVIEGEGKFPFVIISTKCYLPLRRQNLNWLRINKEKLVFILLSCLHSLYFIDFMV